MNTFIKHKVGFKSIIFCLLILLSCKAYSASLLIPMDENQKNHLKAYGLIYYYLQKEISIDWLLNYRGGSFLIAYNPAIESECKVRGVSSEIITDVKAKMILNEIESPALNMNVVRLQKAARIVVYTPKNELISDESDAVISVLDYAEIPYHIVYDEKILQDSLIHFDWLHLHHEDFTGQHGKFLRRESAIIESKFQEITAHQLGYSKVSAMKLDVAKKIKSFCLNGGYLFAMCSGAETIDIALSADGLDINESNYDGDDIDPEAQSKLDYSKSFAFENFTLEPGSSRKFSDINTSVGRWDFAQEEMGYFKLFDFSAKWDIVPSMLTQNHSSVIHEFFGQTSAFNTHLIKPAVLVMGQNLNANKVRYIYGEIGKGHFTFYSGHDPEGFPGARKTVDLNLHPNSAGYRLILNNVLFPSAKKKKQKT